MRVKTLTSSIGNWTDFLAAITPFSDSVQKGFTLLEVVVVMAIIIVIVGATRWNLSFTDQHRQRVTMEKLEQQINYAGMVSAMTGRPIGIGFTRDEYQFYEYGLQRDDRFDWSSSGRRALRGAQLKQGAWRLVLDGVEVILDSEPVSKPQLLFRGDDLPPDYQISILPDNHLKVTSGQWQSAVLVR